MNADEYYYVEDGYFWGHYSSLNEHLQSVRPIIDEFCLQNNFNYVDRRSIGRSPRVRIERAGNPKIWFDLWMELDETGRVYETFQHDRPYELSCGAVLAEGNMSYYKILVCFTGKPFNEVGPVLKQEMEHALSEVEQWDAKFLIENGESEDAQDTTLE